MSLSARQLESIDPRRVLNLTLQREWFDKIYTGDKVEEYRSLTEHWKKHLEEAQNDPAYPGGRYQVILFRNGYNADSPRMWVEFKGLKQGRDDDGAPAYVIRLGSILKTTDYAGPDPAKWKSSHTWKGARRSEALPAERDASVAATHEAARHGK